jgi:cyanophycinase-like exopeptidase
MAIFGSGEVSSTGRRVHELLVNKFKSPVKIALLETPTGYEDNPHLWHIKMAEFMVQGLGNYHPEVNRIEALAKFDIGGTNDDRVLKGLDEAVYIHAGAGSPSYALKHLQDSLAFKKIISAFENGASVSFASAMAIAAGKYCLPVYEMYFAGHDPSWLPGLDFLGRWGLNLTIIPHWNNTEGGKDIDTRFAYMGEKRFLRLINILPGPTTIMGIDEHTAAVFDIKNKIVSVMGKGEVHLFGEHPEAYKNGSQIPFAQLTRMCYFPK